MKYPSTKSPKHVTSLESIKVPCEDGVTTETSNVFEHLEECDCSISPRSIQPSKRIRKTSTSSIPECPLKNKKTIYKDKNNSLETIYLTNIPDSNMTTSLTSPLDLTSKDQACYRFWDSSKKEKYQRLSWLPETDWLASDLNSLNGCVQNSELSSWFSTTKIQPQNPNCPKTLWQSSKFIVVDGTEKEDIPKEKIKARKLKLRPTSQQKQILQQWAGCNRFLYNKTIGLLTNKKNKTLRDVFRIRDRLVTITGKHIHTKNSFYNNKEWLKEPYL